MRSNQNLFSHWFGLWLKPFLNTSSLTSDPFKQEREASVGSFKYWNTFSCVSLMNWFQSWSNLLLIAKLKYIHSLKSAWNPNVLFLNAHSWLCKSLAPFIKILKRGLFTEDAYYFWLFKAALLCFLCNVAVCNLADIFLWSKSTLKREILFNWKLMVMVLFPEHAPSG